MVESDPERYRSRSDESERLFVEALIRMFLLNEPIADIPPQRLWGPPA